MSLCECGCGLPAPVPMQNNASKGHIKGHPLRFRHGHHGRGKTGADAPNWKGGRLVDATGHRRVLVGKTHPMADSKGYCYEHRLVAAAAIGRMLRGDEDVHHIDLDPLNNEPANLLVVSRSLHQRIHRLIDSGAIDPAEARSVS